MSKKVIIIILVIEFIFCINKDGKILCDRCHSHNDYMNELPLLNAIDHGYESIEVDIFLHKNSLFVAHYWWMRKKDAKIDNIYLDQLYDIFKNNNGYIYKKETPLMLLVDIKSKGNDTYKLLENKLIKYNNMLSYVRNDSIFEGAVTIVLSGNKPSVELLRKKNKRHVFIDGRLSDLGKNISINMMPLISINWKDEFQWRGRGEMSQKDKMHLNELIYQVHLEGKKIRFWGSPDNSISWEVLYKSGVDLINTDKVADLYDYMLQK